MKALQELGPEKFGLAPVGTGPYKFVELVRDSHLTVEAFDGYWGPKPALTRVTYVFISDSAARVNALLSGDIQLMGGLDPRSVRRVTEPD